MAFGTLGRECQHTVSVGTRLTLPVPSLLEAGSAFSPRPKGAPLPARLSPPPLSAYGPGATAAGFEQDGVGVSKLVRVAGNSDLQAERDFGTPRASSARLTLEARTVRDVRRSTPPRLVARGRKDASVEPKELFSLVHRCRYPLMVRRAESLKLPGDTTLAIAVAVSLVLFAWGLSEFVRSL